MRGLDRNLVMRLATWDWISHSLLLIGPAGVGKSWLACALGHNADCDEAAPSFRYDCAPPT
ncbi:ATP-binding protein [Mesorhizobium sp. WSM3862]|uniref:ATP-binding protein n=1 Tax=Mesorhizobium sp. WSM3862 TaxID=632858 RepID=UPI001FDF3666|nr:ATP-binding protein [Mesorhizobium sp. WSM3862]